MAKKLYEEENIRAIANKLREFTLDKEATFTVKEMPIGIELVCQNEYEDGYDRGYDDGYSDGQASLVTDLKGRTCHVPSGWTATAGYGTFSVNGSVAYKLTNGTTTTKEIIQLRIGKSPGAPAANYIEFLASSNSMYYLQSTQEFTITIIDGDDATNSDLFNWLDSNGDFTTSEEYSSGYQDGYAAGETAALAGYVDWNMMTTSSSCSIYFSNNHPTYSVFISFEVEEFEGGYGFEGSITIPPESSYSWDDGELGHSGLSGAEWELYVSEMRFIKDAGV